MAVEFDLPRRFLALHRTAIDNWLEGAIPGHTLCIHLGASPAMSPFVSTSAIERNTVVLRLAAFDRKPGLLVEPSDRYSRRLVDQAEERLAFAQARANPPPLTAKSIVAPASTRH